MHRRSNASEFLTQDTRSLVGGACLGASLVSGAEIGAPQLIGTWRGTSTCSDRVAAPACNDDAVVYEFSAGPQPGTVTWKADKVVNGERQTERPPHRRHGPLAAGQADDPQDRRAEGPMMRDPAAQGAGG
jgi:hypothetical protein